MGGGPLAAEKLALFIFLLASLGNLKCHQLQKPSSASSQEAKEILNPFLGRNSEESKNEGEMEKDELEEKSVERKPMFPGQQPMNFDPNRAHSLRVAFSRRLSSRSLPFNGVKARKMPCCTETIGMHTCAELRNKRPTAFRKRCKADADFAILQCCQTCRTNVAELGSDLFSHGLKSKHCFDRHNRNYCSNFIHQSGMWAANAGKLVNCNGDSASLAFRVCRRSCGFCEPALYDQKTARNCTRGSGVNPTIKGGKPEVEIISGKKNNVKESTQKGSKTGNDGKKKPKENKEKASEKGKEKETDSKKGPSPPRWSSTSSKMTTMSSSTAATTHQSTTAEHSPSPPPGTAPPPTLRPTFIPPTTPKLLPCPTPPPLPPLPPIPCRPPLPPLPLPTLAPLTQATISVPEQTPRPFRPVMPPVPPPIHPIMPIMPVSGPFPRLPLLPLPVPSPKPIIPQLRPKPKRPPPPPQRPTPKVTIEWKPVPPPPSTGGEVGPWPEWPWPLPDEMIESILNQLSGVDDKRAGRSAEECSECSAYDVKEKRTKNAEVSKAKFVKKTKKLSRGEDEVGNGDEDYSDFLLDWLLGIGNGKDTPVKNRPT